MLDIVNRMQHADSYLFCSSDKNGVFITEDCVSLVDNEFQYLDMQPSAKDDHLIAALNVLFHPNRVIKKLFKFFNKPIVNVYLIFLISIVNVLLKAEIQQQFVENVNSFVFKKSNQNYFDQIILNASGVNFVIRLFTRRVLK